LAVVLLKGLVLIPLEGFNQISSVHLTLFGLHFCEKFLELVGDAVNFIKVDILIIHKLIYVLSKLFGHEK